MVRKVNSKRKNQEEANINFRTSNSIQQGDGLDEMKARLQVMKFGGTSVGDAACIARTAQIIAKAAKESGCIAVVSARSGVSAKERRCCGNSRPAPSTRFRAWVKGFPHRSWRQQSESWGCQAKRSK